MATDFTSFIADPSAFIAVTFLVRPILLATGLSCTCGHFTFSFLLQLVSRPVPISAWLGIGCSTYPGGVFDKPASSRYDRIQVYVAERSFQQSRPDPTAGKTRWDK